MGEKTIHLNDLKTCCKLTPARCANFSEAAAVCLEKQGHLPDVKLMIRGDIEAELTLTWEKTDASVYASWANLEEAVEEAAYAIAILTVWSTTAYTVISQSEKGSGVDFWCGEKQADFPFQNKMRVEVSGILRGSMGRINTRIKEKIIQAKSGFQSPVPFIIIVTEFSRPLVKTAKND